VDWGREWKPLLTIVAVVVAVWYLPVGGARFDTAVTEALELTKWYAREHVLLCLVPRAPKALAYSVASVSGTILAVRSCTVLPLFAGIYTTGAGLGPATAFLYSGPAINVLAIILTARVLGLHLGIARAGGPSCSGHHRRTDALDLSPG